MTDSNPVGVVARVTARPGQTNAARTILLSLLEPTRRENGCIHYEMYVDPDNPAVFTFIEKWASHAALDAHMQTEHFKSAITQLGAVAEPPDIKIVSFVA